MEIFAFFAPRAAFERAAAAAREFPSGARAVVVNKAGWAVVAAAVVVAAGVAVAVVAGWVDVAAAAAVFFAGAG